MINQKITAYFSAKASIAPLIVFRIIVGALLFYGTTRFLLKGWVEALYIQPSFHFGYLGFEWVQKLPGAWMYLPFIICLVASLGILFGAFYRLSTLLFFLSFTYIELLDKSYYLNHYYFISLISFLLIFLPANQRFSVDARRKGKAPLAEVPKWTIDILKFQIACVYVFAGIAKLNSDWLFEAQPLHTWLQAHHQLPVVGSLLKEKATAYVFSWIGCAYDLAIVFLLLKNNTRKIAYAFVIAFHLMTWWLFPIGIFPLVMILMTLLFFSTQFHEGILSKLERVTRYVPTSFAKSKGQNSAWAQSLIVVYVVLQLLIPFRYLLYPGNLYWTEEGFRFSWRVMLMHKEGHATFFVQDQKTKKEIEINNGDYLTTTQEDQMATQPDMILQYARMLQAKFHNTTLHFGTKKIELENPKVFATIFVSLNGRQSQEFVAKNTELSDQPYNLQHRKWLEPFQN